MRAAIFQICTLLLFSGLAHMERVRADTPDIRRVLMDHAGSVCSAAAMFAVDAPLIVGVVLAENELNAGAGDAVQAAYVKGLLAAQDEDWFRRWKARNEQSAQQSMPVRLLSNKWPAELWASGYVQSYGPAQVTPRTAIAACEHLQTQVPVCRKSPKQVVRAMVEVPSFLYMVAAILRHEIESAPRQLAARVRADHALWATLYNVGGEYFFATYIRRYGMKPNRFGAFVRGSIERDVLAIDCRQ